MDSEQTGTPRSVLIIGGGTAGWLTAASLAKAFGTGHPGAPTITVLESPDIGIIGVGEGTFPTIRQTLKNLGIEEALFMRESHATFKQGIRFDDWEVTPKEGRHAHYFHPFEPPYWGREELNLLPYWLLQDKATRKPFAQAVTFQKRIADAKMGPKRIHQGHYAGPLNYAYHFDAVKFAACLAKHAKNLGVKHIEGNLTGVALDDTGAIDHVITAEHGSLVADLYVDCTGFRSELIGKALGVPFHKIKDILFTDRAVAMQVPDEGKDDPIPSYTISTAHEAGWTWDIALDGRRGIGYVYSSDHSSDDRAEEILRGYIGPRAEGLNARRIKFEAGYRTKHWVKNCVAVGLSAGFLEPLESTGVVLIESAINKIIEFFPHGGPMDASADSFNEMMVARYNTIIGFIKLHYCLSRRDEPFWRDNADPKSIPAHLHDLLALWRHRPPSRYDFTLDNESFAYFSYQYILYGMNYDTDYEAARAASPMIAKAEEIFARVVNFGEQASKDLIPHRQLLNAVYRGGFVEPPAPARPVAQPIRAG